MKWYHHRDEVKRVQVASAVCSVHSRLEGTSAVDENAIRTNGGHCKWSAKGDLPHDGK